MDHLEAASLGATEKYLLGTLSEAEREAFEEHFFDCLDCAEDVRAASAVMAGAAALSASPGADVVADRAPPTISRLRRWRFPRASGTVAAMGSMAAALCLAAYQGFVVIPRLRGEVHEASALQSVPSYFLTQARSTGPVLVVSPSDRKVALTLSRSWGGNFTSYRCELRDESGRLILAETVRAHSTTDELQVLLPVADLPAGSYVLVVEGADGKSGSGEPAARYAFQLERR
jgi:hypothetical protein